MIYFFFAGSLLPKYASNGAASAQNSKTYPPIDGYHTYLPKSEMLRQYSNVLTKLKVAVIIINTDVPTTTQLRILFLKKNCNISPTIRINATTIVVINSTQEITSNVSPEPAVSAKRRGNLLLLLLNVI